MRGGLPAGPFSWQTDVSRVCKKRADFVMVLNKMNPPRTWMGKESQSREERHTWTRVRTPQYHAFWGRMDRLSEQIL